MKVTLTNTAKGKLFVSDVGEVRTPKLTRNGATLTLNTLTTLPDDEATLASLKTGELSKAVLAGDITINEQPATITQRYKQVFTATNAQTAFVLTGDLTMDTTRPDLVDVYQGAPDGALLKRAAGAGNYQVTNATTITLGTGATTGDTVTVIFYK